MGKELSRKKLEEYSYKINKLIDDAKFDLNIPAAESYGDEEIKNINKSWEQAFSKIAEAQKLIQELLNLIGADNI